MVQSCSVPVISMAPLERNTSSLSKVAVFLCRGIFSTYFNKQPIYCQASSLVRTYIECIGITLLLVFVLVRIRWYSGQSSEFRPGVPGVPGVRSRSSFWSSEFGVPEFRSSGVLFLLKLNYRGTFTTSKRISTTRTRSGVPEFRSSELRNSGTPKMNRQTPGVLIRTPGYNCHSALHDY